MTIRVLGQNLTTSLEKSGSYAAAQVHNSVREDILMSDLSLIENTMNKLIKKAVDLNFADVKEYPVFCFNK